MCGIRNRNITHDAKVPARKNKLTPGDSSHKRTRLVISTMHAAAENIPVSLMAENRSPGNGMWSSLHLQVQQSLVKEESVVASFTLRPIREKGLNFKVLHPPAPWHAEKTGRAATGHTNSRCSEPIKGMYVSYVLWSIWTTPVSTYKRKKSTLESWALAWQRNKSK